MSESAPILTAVSSRDTAFLDDLEQRLKQFVSMGVVLVVAGILLLTWLSHSSIGATLGAAVVIIGATTIMWSFSEGSKRWIGIGVLVFLIGSILYHNRTGRLVDVGETFGWIAIIVGPVYIWIGLRGLRSLSRARESLKAALFDVRLEVEIRRGYGGIPYTKVWLWPIDPDTDGRPLARFGWQWSAPRYMAASKVTAQVYGAPTRGADVVVSCAQGVLTGRVRWSRFGDDRPARPVPAVVRWLFKERRLHLP